MQHTVRRFVVGEGGGGEDKPSFLPVWHDVTFLYHLALLQYLCGDVLVEFLDDEYLGGRKEGGQRDRGNGGSRERRNKRREEGGSKERRNKRRERGIILNRETFKFAQAHHSQAYLE